MLTTKSFFDLSDFPHASLFNETKPVWEALNSLKSYMDTHNYPNFDSDLIRDGIPLTQSVILYQGQFFSTSDYTVDYGDTTKGKLIVKKGNEVLKGAAIIMAGAILLGNKIDIGEGTFVEGGALIKSPAIIGNYTEVRQGAYLRGYVLAGKRCVLGHTTEVKHSIFLNDAKAGHFAYLGDSILGQDANLGAGTKFANLKFLGGNISIRTKDGLVDTGRRKFGAILGDGAQTGCNSVTNPGTIFGKGTILMPNTTAQSGYHKPKTIVR
jgi:UDP-N-acetylglucosamine diphosphorylase / glucose-1-phosphate thymidylyltransferase / UDP-N-acetylgalactosamine diphosphorylase / glucosamine-1-phosphate N-acetyltransferase / galactosamine-1-phosphate N-acetyltransferase